MPTRVNLRYVLIFLWGLALLIPPITLTFSHSYFFNANSLGNFLASYFVGALGIVVADRAVIENERFYLLLFNLSIFLWLWAEGFGHLCPPDRPTLAISWFKTANVGVVFIAAHVYAFTVSFLKLERRKLITLAYSLATLFAILDIFTSYFVSGVHWFRWGYYPQWNFIKTAPYFWYFSGYLGISLFEYFRAYKKSSNAHVKNQIKYLILGFSMSYLGSIDYLPALGYDVYPFGFIAILGWWTTLAYAILKHRLMDITVIIRKTLIYSLVMGTLAGIYLSTITIFTHLFQGLTGYQTVFSSGVAAGLMTLCFQPLRKRVQAFVDTKFFRQYVDREEKLYELSREVITHTTPEAMGEALMRVLGDSFHPKTATLYLKSRNGSGFLPVAFVGETKPERMEEDNPLSLYFADHSQPFVQDLPSEIGTPQSTRKRSDRVRSSKEAAA
jgi:hypothetical protein